jgi:hypothetical protein
VKDSFYEELECIFDKHQCQSRQINHFKPTIGNGNLHEINNDDGVRVVNFAISKNLIFRSTKFPHCSIHKHNWTSPERKTHHKNGHILTDMRSYSSVLDVRSFRAADCDTDHYLVVAKNRERLAVNKQGSHNFHMERFNLKKLNDVEAKEKHGVEFSNRFAILEDLDPEIEFSIV